MRKAIFIFALALLTTVGANAAVKRQFTDANFPTQQMVEKQTFTDPAAAGTTNVLSAHAGITSTSAVTITTFVAQPDMPRNLVITPGGSTSNVEACTVVINGKDILNQSLSENFTIADNLSTASTGSKAFKSISSIVIPAACETSPYGATWSVGFGEKLGVKNCLDSAGHIFFSTLNGAKEATAPTMAVSASAVSGNTADFNGTMNGSNDFELFFIQNFRCLP